jgi:hypothetical protein
MALMSRIDPVAVLVAGCLVGGPTGAPPDSHQGHNHVQAEPPELRAAARAVT